MNEEGFLGDPKSRLVEELEHRTHQDATQQKKQQKEKGEMPTTGQRDKIDKDGKTRDVGKNEE